LHIEQSDYTGKKEKQAQHGKKIQRSENLQRCCRWPEWPLGLRGFALCSITALIFKENCRLQNLNRVQSGQTIHA